MQSLSQHYRTALVTGASSGLGAAFAEMLVREGLVVYGTSRDPARITLPGVRPLCLDLADPAAIGQLMEAQGELLDSLDILVNYAGFSVFSSFFEIHPADMGEQIKVLLHGPMALCHRVLPGMLSRPRAAIVNISSLAADFPLPWMGVYSACKAGLSQFSRSLALELAGTDLAVIDFQPGDFRTAFNEAVRKPASMDEQEQRLWHRIEAHMQAGPTPAHAAADLRRALFSRRSRVIRSGTFFQARLAPFFFRLAPWSLTCWSLRKYYGLGHFD